MGKVIDIRCTTGEWCYFVTQCGAETVDRIDIQEELVKPAKQATSGQGMGNCKVSMQLGDATDTPYYLMWPLVYLSPVLYHLQLLKSISKNCIVC